MNLRNLSGIVVDPDWRDYFASGDLYHLIKA